MSFGWSAGDIVSCIALIVRVSKGLKDSTGASAEYEAAVDFLDGLKTNLDKLKEHLETHPDTFHANDIEEQAERLKTAVEKFKVKAEKFESSLGSESTRSSIRRALRKIQWTLFADSIKELQRAISQPQNVLNTILLLQTLKAAEQASQRSALSQQELARIALAVMDVLPLQLASTANDLKAALTEGFGSVAEKQQEELSERQQEIQQLRESIEQQGQKYVDLETSLKSQQQLVLDTLESCVQARLDALFEASPWNDASANESVDTEIANPENDSGNTDNDANLFIGMAAGLHMLGYLMSGLLGPVLTPPSSNNRRNSDSAAVDARFLAVFDSIASNLGNGSPVELPRDIVTSSWTNACEEESRPHISQNYLLAPSVTGWWVCCRERCRREVDSELFGSFCPDCTHETCNACQEMVAPNWSVATRSASEAERRLSTPDSNSHSWVDEFQNDTGILRTPRIQRILKESSAYLRRQKAFDTCTFLFSFAEVFPRDHVGSHNPDGFYRSQPHDLKPLKSDGQLYRWSKGQFSRIFSSKVFKSYSCATLLGFSDGRYLATPNDATLHESKWDTLTLSGAMSTESYKFLDYSNENHQIDTADLSVLHTAELQIWGRDTEPIHVTRCSSGRLELALACIADTFPRIANIELDTLPPMPWRYTNSWESHPLATTNGVFVQVWLDPDNPTKSTPEALSIVQTCPLFLYTEADSLKDFFQHFIQRPTMKRVTAGKKLMK